MLLDIDMSENYIKLSDISAFTIADDLSDKVWDIVLQWTIFAKRTIGEQFVKSIDSISANIAEGFGRYFRKDKVKFYYYARGSVQEAINWLEKSFRRNLIATADYEMIKAGLFELPKDINSLIRYTYTKLKT